jgi:hypothetical protein
LKLECSVLVFALGVLLELSLSGSVLRISVLDEITYERVKNLRISIVPYMFGEIGIFKRCI